MSLASIQPAENAALLRTTDVESLAEFLRVQRAALFEAATAHTGGVAFARSYSDLIDSIIRRMLGFACEKAGYSGASETIPIAIVATGGYGRKELCPHSDIDITFIPARDGDALLDRVIKEMFTLVMRVFIDASGMSVGYAYRLMQDCLRLDHQTTSGLLDARLIAGSDRLFIQFEHEFWSGFNPADFIFAKLAERSKQLSKHGFTPRVVEPDLKEGAGGLRDLQSALWVTQALHGLAAARVRGERSWEVLTRHADVSDREAAQLQAAKEFLFRLRTHLHLLTGAERDQLVVTRQEELADKLGYGEIVPLAGDAPPVERMMRDYYTHASAASRIAGDVMRRVENHRMFLGIGLDCKRRQIVPANSALDAEDPIWMLWACELAQKYDLGFSDDLQRVIVDLVATGPAVRDADQAAEVFTRILGSPKGAYPILQRMADLGILTWLIPEFGFTLDLIPYDPSHDFTVGQHTLVVIRHIDSLRSASTGEEMNEFRHMIAEMTHPEELYLAALLHDAGKAMHDRPHSEAGAEVARAVCGRMRWSEAATANVEFLVRHHLLMAETSRLRDMHLDETIRDFTAIVDDADRLHMLYLLTYADTNAVGAGVWTQVKGRFLRDLLRRAERFLMEAEGEPADDAGLTRTRRRLMKELTVENLPQEDVSEHVESMPPTYLLNTSLSEIALHIDFVRRARQGIPTIDFFDERDSTFTEVTVCTRDDPQPGLLAKIAGVFYAADLDVHSAQVFTRVTEHGANNGGVERIAIDKFFVDFRGRQLTPGKRKEISTNLTAVLTGATDVRELLAKRRKPSEIGGPVKSLVVRSDLSETYTVIEVTVDDSRGMLYRASGALSAANLSIHSARVSEFKGKNVAGFYVAGGRSRSESDLRRELLNLMPLEGEGTG